MDLLLVGAREKTADAADTVVSGLIEATAAETLSATPVGLVVGQPPRRCGCGSTTTCYPTAG